MESCSEFPLTLCEFGAAWACSCAIPTWSLLMLPPKGYLGGVPRSEQLITRHIICYRRSRKTLPISNYFGEAWFKSLSHSASSIPVAVTAISLRTISSRFSASSTLDKTPLCIGQERFNGSWSSCGTLWRKNVYECYILCRTVRNVQQWLKNADIQKLQGARSRASIAGCCLRTEKEYVGKLYFIISAGSVEADAWRGEQHRLRDVTRSNWYSRTNLISRCHRSFRPQKIDFKILDSSVPKKSR